MFLLNNMTAPLWLVDITGITIVVHTSHAAIGAYSGLSFAMYINMPLEVPDGQPISNESMNI